MVTLFSDNRECSLYCFRPFYDVGPPSRPLSTTLQPVQRIFKTSKSRLLPARGFTFERLMVRDIPDEGRLNLSASVVSAAASATGAEPAAVTQTKLLWTIKQQQLARYASASKGASVAVVTYLRAGRVVYWRHASRVSSQARGLTAKRRHNGDNTPSILQKHVVIVCQTRNHDMPSISQGHRSLRACTAALGRPLLPRGRSK